MHVKKLLRGEETVAYRRHIGGGFYVSVKSGYACVDIRKYYKTYDDEDEEKAIKPTKTGISLRCEEWAKLWCLIDDVNAVYPSLADAQPCYYNEDHMNQLGWLECAECHPFRNSALAKLMSYITSGSGRG